MSIFYHIENFPYTIEREDESITPANDKDKSVITITYLKLENIFNDNARIGT
jgi:hypothetical protein